MSVRFDGAFRRVEVYRALASQACCVIRESDPCIYGNFSERHLQCVWYDGRWRPDNLVTVDGEKVVVEHPGRWNLEAGPDFIDARLIIGSSRRVCGDVEIHHRARDWYAHGHMSDPAFRRVVAHVCYDVGNPTAGLPPNMITIPLRDSLKTDPSFSFENIDVTAYPYAVQGSWSPPCARLLADMPEAKLTAILSSAGEARVSNKAAVISNQIAAQGQDQVLYEEVMGALGYKRNASMFRSIARSITLADLHEACPDDPVSGYALLLGTSNLLPTNIESSWDNETRKFVRGLWDHWWKQRSNREELVLNKKEWQLHGVRPTNHPVRRLAAAAALFVNTNESLADRWTSLAARNTTDWPRYVTEDLTGLTMDYWTNRLSFSGERRQKPCALVGKERAAAIITNVAVPFLVSMGCETGPLLDKLPPEHDNSLIRQAANSLLGRDHNPMWHRRGLLQQGLLQIFHDFCLPSRNSCEACRFLLAFDDASANNHLDINDVN